eukprot:TRINITY_DN3148_c0_g1_i1.p2 TRINITY_DN3148_c0_g1~~TRINITY_DN3148_c0_g1_i1.p2  ORF type:complete len:535 (-),score=66.93 TRINITY_DN3148_c0_g1_i1:3261-4865(-)
MKSLSREKHLEGWEIGSDFEIVKLLGSGSYGSVCEAIHKPSRTTVAIKKVLNLFDDKVDCKRVLREVHLLRKLRHPNVVRLYEILEPKDPKRFDCVYLVLEYAQSDIKKLVKSAIHLQKIHIQKLVYNLLVGLKYTHSAGVLHRDIKPANILINEDCSVKICDFGLGRSVEGVKGTSIKLMKKNLNNLEELQAASDDEDVGMKGSQLAKIKTDSEEMTDISAAMSFKPQKLTKAEEEKKATEEVKKKEIQSQIHKTRELRRSMKRQLTGHVVTRWYRAPEIILLEKDYGSAVDVWSVGCIFAELLSMMKENAATYQDRQPLFPGTSCFPLSPDHKVCVKKGGFPSSNSDQLNVIFDVIGTPNEEEMSFVTDTKALEYLKTFAPRKRVDFKARYPAAGDDAIDLLNKMLVFNPFFRITVDDCLNHPFLASVRDKSLEKLAPEVVKLGFETEKDLDERRLRELFLEEINHYKMLRTTGKTKYQAQIVHGITYSLIACLNALIIDTKRYARAIIINLSDITTLRNKSIGSKNRNDVH